MSKKPGWGMFADHFFICSFLVPFDVATIQRRRRPPVVAARRLLRDLSAQLLPTAITTASATCNGITPSWITCSELGVDAIWITPCFPSPQVDFGYDVSDYEDIDPDVRHARRLRRRWQRDGKAQQFASSSTSW